VEPENSVERLADGEHVSGIVHNDSRGILASIEPKCLTDK